MGSTTWDKPRPFDPEHDYPPTAATALGCQFDGQHWVRGDGAVARPFSPEGIACAREWAITSGPQCCPSCIVIDGDPPAVQPHDGHTCWRCGCEERVPRPS